VRYGERTTHKSFKPGEVLEVDGALASAK